LKKYAINEVFGTLQGEGAQSGSPSVFLRFAGCNLGYEVCPWCDTDWARTEYLVDVEGVLELVRRCAIDAFGEERHGLLLVATGGEPSIQFDRPLADALRGRGYRISMESNGSRPVDRTLVDWLTISPKQNEYVQKDGDELKIVFTGGAAPGPAASVDDVRRLAEGTSFRHYFLQPLDDRDTGPNFAATSEAVMQLGPPWRLSVQTHKILGIP
jgi:7-carboxy-7-deazaguanine synthase